MANKVSYLIQLQDRFSRQAEKIRSASRKMERGLSKVRIELKKTGERFTKFQGKMKSSAKGMAKMGAVAFATATVPIALLGRSMINAASDAVETANKFNSVFDDVRDKANKVADDFAKNFGVAGSTARKMIGDTGDLLVGFGFTGDAALKLAKDVNELASDLASFQNFSAGAGGASIALTKALLGESESAKALGIVIRQGTPEFTRNVAIIQRSRRVTLLQAKAIEILRISMTQSRKAIGDVNRTWNDYANVVRRSDEKTKQLRESFGTLLLPTATKLIIKLTSLVDWINNLSPPMKDLVLVVGGFIAIGGPLLLLLAGIALAVSLITLPVLAVVGAIGLMVAAGVLIIKNWEGIKGGAKALWEDVSGFFSSMVNAVLEFSNAVVGFALTPINAVADKIASIGASIGNFFSFGETEIKASQTVTQRSQTDVNVNLLAPEKTVASVKTRTSGKNPGLNVGVNMEVAV